jgi:hypothetical protein
VILTGFRIRRLYCLICTTSRCGSWLIGSEPLVFIEVFPIWFVKDLPGLLGDSDSSGTSSQ